MIFIYKNNNLPIEFNSIEILIKKLSIQAKSKISLQITELSGDQVGLSIKKYFSKYKSPKVFSVTKKEDLGLSQQIGFAICEETESDFIKTE